MATPVTQNTFLSVYNDDYRDSDHYHRILFNSGRALQARELTQMQTIIQSELARLAGFVLKEGGIFNTSYGVLNAGFNAVGFVKVNSLPTGYATIVGTEVINSVGVRATVKAIIPATGLDNNTLLVRYISSNNLTASVTTSPKIFEPNDTLTYDTGTISGTLTVQTTNTSGNPATGKGSMIEVPQFNTFVAGHLVMVEAQSLVLDKYNAYPTVNVGFKLSEDIITTTDNIALYDNTGTTPNLTSPGADRYRILLTLAKESDITSGETFYPVYTIIRGQTRAVQTRDNVLNELGKILYDRTYNITGDFIVRDNSVGTFDLEIAEDSDPDYLQYRIDPGIAFVKGNRIEIPYVSTIRIAKPRDLINDVETKTNEFVTARYGNYFLADEDSAFGLVGKITNLENVNLYNDRTRFDVSGSGTLIGTARIRHIDKFDDQFRIHVFDIAMDSDGSGSSYNIANARLIGTDSANYAVISPILPGKFDLVDRFENSLLFPLPGERVQEVTSVTMAVRKIYTTTTNGSGQATFSTGSSNIFTDQENWVLAVDSSGELFDPPTVSGTPTTSAVITGLPFSSAVTMLAFETITAVRKTKTLITGQTQVVSVTNERFTLSYADIYKFTSVVDDTTGEDITYKFLFDNGQRDNFYTVGGGRLRKGATVPAGTVTVTFDYFSHNAGDFFAGKPSYPNVSYENVPVFIASTGAEYRLTDVIDMRPVKNNTGTGFTGTGSVIENIPKNTGLITVGTAKYWQPRADVIAMSPEGQLTAYPGDTSFELKAPAGIPANNMALYSIVLRPYVLDAQDVSVQTYSNAGYQMRDIEDLENRIANLEELATLTQAELLSIQTAVPDPNDATLPDRIKIGMTADPFINNVQSAVLYDDYRATIARLDGAIAPLTFLRDLPLKYDSDQSFYTVIKGSTVWPIYSEEVMINQNVASKPVNVNQFEVAKSVGGGFLEPNVDTWTIRKKVDNSYKVASNTSFVQKGSFTIASQGEQSS